MVEIRDNPEDRTPGMGFDDFDAVGEELRVASELVHHKPDDALLLGRGHEHEAAEERRKDAAPIDIAHQNAGGIGHLGHGEVDQVVFLEIELDGAPRPFQDDHVVLLAPAARSSRGLRKPGSFCAR